jgi:hypothetical protein
MAAPRRRRGAGAPCALVALLIAGLLGAAAAAEQGVAPDPLAAPGAAAAAAAADAAADAAAAAAARAAAAAAAPAPAPVPAPVPAPAPAPAPAPTPAPAAALLSAGAGGGADGGGGDGSASGGLFKADPPTRAETRALGWLVVYHPRAVAEARAAGAAGGGALASLSAGDADPSMGAADDPHAAETAQLGRFYRPPKVCGAGACAGPRECRSAAGGWGRGGAPKSRRRRGWRAHCPRGPPLSPARPRR